MSEDDEEKLFEIVADTYLGYGKESPGAAFLAAWVTELEGVPLEVIERAIRDYKESDERYPPNPVVIAKRCKQLDGRPGVEEAWAMSLKTEDETQTVVWTVEMAAAFEQCAPILKQGDEVGARMAFKEAYKRFVDGARSMGRAVKWSVLPGSDATMLKRVTAKAVAIGQISNNAEYIALAPAVIDLPRLESNAGSVEVIDPRAEISRLKEMLKGLESSEVKAAKFEKRRLERENAN